MGTLSRGQTFTVNDQVTNTKLHNLVDGGSVSNIVRTDMNSADTSVIHLAGVEPPSPNLNEVWYDIPNDTMKRFNATAFVEIISSTTKLTNKSGGDLLAGDLVIADSSNDNAFTTTTSVANELVIGVLTEDTADNAIGVIQNTGLRTVNCTGVTAGFFIQTSATVKTAGSVVTKSLASCGRALESGTGLKTCILFL